jgi:pimeloyl-ACP methyl ester carboxylesterase
MIRRMRRRALAATLAVIVLALLWIVKDAMAIGAIITPPSPDYHAGPIPPEVTRAIEIERDRARIRGWVIDPDRTPVGTIVLLHGIRSSKEDQLPRAVAFAREGFRAVVLDHRGHGESSGRWLCYGARETHDVVAILDGLEADDLLARPLGVMGSSYGAAIAIQVAAIDPRIDATVAIAPFASLREVVPAYVEWFLGPLVAAITPNAWIQSVVDRAGREADFDPDDACARCAASLVRSPLLLIHSRDDERIPFRQAERIRDAANGHAELLLISGPPHVETGRAPAATEAVHAFFARHLRGG